MGKRFDKRDGWITPFIIRLAEWWSDKASIIGRIGRKLKRKHSKCEYVVVEILVFVCLIIEVGILASLQWCGYFSLSMECTTLWWQTIISWIIIILLAYRLTDILLYWIYVYLDPRAVHRRKGVGPSAPRAIVLALVNLIEVILIFGIVDFIFSFAFNNIFDSVKDSLMFSIQTITTMGSNSYSNINNALGFLLVIGEILCGLLFLIVIISRALTFYKDK